MFLVSCVYNLHKSLCTNITTQNTVQNMQVWVSFLKWTGCHFTWSTNGRRYDKQKAQAEMQTFSPIANAGKLGYGTK